MGRNTWASLPSEYKPLPKRENIVLTTKVDKPVIVNPDCTLHFNAFIEGDNKILQ